MDPHCLGRTTFDAAALMREHPPRFQHPNKRLVFERAMAGAPPSGILTYSRWSEPALPEALPEPVPRVLIREDVFAYDPSPEGSVRWHLNFAHEILFVAYGGALLAQDELQVLEHPALGAVREALVHTTDPGLRPHTREQRRATPVLLTRVERRCALATDADLDEGRPLGLYGNRFARASSDTVLRALRVLTPPTYSNLVAIEAPPGGVGRYSRAEINRALATALAGFSAARTETQTMAPGARAVLHTGHWGTGAYGGDRVLMAMLQLLAARAAGLAELVFHTVTPEAAAPVREAQRRLDALPSRSLAHAIDAIDATAFTWGASDGN